MPNIENEEDDRIICAFTAAKIKAFEAPNQVNQPVLQLNLAAEMYDRLAAIECRGFLQRHMRLCQILLSQVYRFQCHPAAAVHRPFLASATDLLVVIRNIYPGLAGV